MRSVVLCLFLCLMAFNLEAQAVASFVVKPLSNEDLSWIARRIYANEANQNPIYLTHWNTGEAFPSFGIGHFIWYPKSNRLAGEKGASFVETFPAMIDFVSKKAHPPVLPPVWLQKLMPFHAPWQTKQQFDQAWENPRLSRLRAWLDKTQLQQAEFIDYGFRMRWQAAMGRLPLRQSRNLNQMLMGLMAFKAGRFAVLDYFNFKGIGHNIKEQYYQQGWGLIDVLQHLPRLSDLSQQKNFLGLPNQVKLNLFIQAAKQVLQRRIQNAPKSRHEARWRRGWFKRLEGYRLNENANS